MVRIGCGSLIKSCIQNQQTSRESFKDLVGMLRSYHNLYKHWSGNKDLLSFVMLKDFSTNDHNHNQ